MISMGFPRSFLKGFCSASFAAAFLALAGCDGDDGSGSGAESVNLGIPDRSWAPGHDDVGWCGETCVQMAVGYYGREISQEEINRAAGSPADISEVDMDVALRTLGVPYEAWNDSNHDVYEFIDWVKSQLDRGRPVICGTKIYPDENPSWYVDHFVVAAGFDATGLLLNTQWDCDGPQLVDYGALASMEEGYAFQNRQSRYFGRAITGAP